MKVINFLHNEGIFVLFSGSAIAKYKTRRLVADRNPPRLFDTLSRSEYIGAHVMAIQKLPYAQEILQGNLRHGYKVLCMLIRNGTWWERHNIIARFAMHITNPMHQYTVCQFPTKLRIHAYEVRLYQMRIFKVFKYDKDNNTDRQNRYVNPIV